MTLIRLSARSQWNLDLSAGYLDMPQLGLGAAKALAFTIKPRSPKPVLLTFYLPFHTFIYS
jgi:hypothetical protein